MYVFFSDLTHVEWQVYLEDALGDRSWVDNDDCKGFVENVKTAFNTKSIPKSFLIQPTDVLKTFDNPSKWPYRYKISVPNGPIKK